MMLPKPGNGTPKNAQKIAIPTIPMNEKKEIRSPTIGMNRRGVYELPKIARIAYGAVTNGLKLDFPDFRGGLSYGTPTDLKSSHPHTVRTNRTRSGIALNARYAALETKRKSLAFRGTGWLLILSISQ